MTKKMTALILILCFVLPLWGCGNSAHTDKLVLALRAGAYADVIKACLPEFEAEHGITCEVLEYTEDDLHKNVLNDCVRRNGSYDLCMVDGSWVMEYLNEEALADLSALGYTLDSDIIPATTTICIQDGKTYLAPYYGNVTVMLYNSKTAAELGIDPADITSLDALLALCEKSSQAQKGGFCFRGDTENNIVVDFLPILRAFGGWVVDSNNNPTVNTTEFANALEFYQKLTKTGGSLAKDELIKGIDAGKMVAAVGWPGWYNAETSSSSDYIAFPGKATEDGQHYNSNIYGIWTLGIPSNCTNKELACELLSYLMDKEVQKKTVENGGVPCRYSVLQDPDILAKNSHFATICTALENGIYRPVMEEWTRFYTILGEEMKKIMSGQESISDGLKLAQDALEAMMKE